MSVQVRDAEVWQLVDQRLDDVRRLPYDELLRRAAATPDEDVVTTPSGEFRRRTRVVALPHERIGIQVAVTAGEGRPRAQGQVIITAEGRPAPEWDISDEAPRGNPFAFSTRVQLIGVAVAALLMLAFLLLV